MIGRISWPGQTPRMSGWTAWLGVASAAVLTVLLAFSAARLTWLLVAEDPDTGAAWPKFGSAGVQPHPLQASDTAVGHLFGRMQSVRDAPEILGPDVALSLRGTFVTSGDTGTHAVLAAADGVESTYFVGDTVPGGEVLQAVSAASVVLQAGARLRTLTLRGKHDDTAYEWLDRSGDLALASYLGTYRARLRENPETLVGLVSLSPVREAGRFVGYQFTGGNDSQFLRRLGLESGDVLTAVNSTAIDSPLKGMDVLKELVTADAIRVDIRRGTRRLRLAFSVRPAQ